MHRYKLAPAVLLLANVILCGCARGGIGEVSGGPTTEQLVDYYSPRSIKILPFTKPRSFDDDVIPDGVEVVLKALDGAQHPVKAYGTFLFELYEYKPALGNHRGQRIQDWQLGVFNLQDQKQLWSAVTSAYEFRLSWDGNPIPAQKKYIIVVSFQAPGGTRLFDEFEFEFRVQREEILNALGGANP